MIDSKLSKKLRNDPRFIPFNDKFDFKFILEYIKKNEKGSIDLNDKIKALTTIFFSQYYESFRNYFSEITDRTQLSKSIFLELTITLANRDAYLISMRSDNSIKKKGILDYDEFTNSSFLSGISEFGVINAQAGLEAVHDGLNTILNLTNKESISTNDKKYCLDDLDNCAKLLGFSNLYAVIKFAYDTAIWENYIISYNNQKEVLKIKCNKDRDQLLNSIGEYRMGKNIFSSKYVMLSAYKEKNNLYRLLSLEAQKKRKSKKLKCVKLIKHEINYELIDGVEEDTILKELLTYSDLSTYYAFIHNEKLPKFKSISLYDIITIHSEIQFLFQNVFELEKPEDKNDLSNFDQYKSRIKKTDLINYVTSKTKYARLQVKEIVELLSHQNGHYNIWEQPFIELNSFIIPIYLPLLYPNSLRLIDFWLEKGGFDLDARGSLFEKHIKDVLVYTLKNKGYHVDCPENSVFRNKKGDFEEIDLILELKNVTFIAEIKCIKYPFDPRDYHNMYKRLAEGIGQLKRKAEFVINNQQDFKKGSYFEKRIVTAVITNYPMFSGYIIDNIPITDFSLIENYFISGSLNKGTLDKDNNDSATIKYYQNEDELSNNLNAFLKNPIPIEDKLNDTYIEETQISLPDAIPKIVMDYVRFNQVNII